MRTVCMHLCIKWMYPYLVRRCAVIRHIRRGATQTFNCRGMKGRYVNIVIPRRREYLTLCEVEVYAQRTIARRRIIPTGRY